MQEHLAQEQGIASGFGRDRFDEVRRHRVSRERFKKVRHSLLRETRKPDVLNIDFAPQRNEGVPERVFAVELHVPVSAQDENRMAREETREMAQQRERPPVRPVQIVEYDYKWRPACHGPMHLSHGVEQPMAFLLWGEGDGLWQIGQPLAQLRGDLGDDPTKAAHVLTQHLGIGLRRVACNRFSEGSEGSRELALEAAPPQHPCAVRPRVRCELLEEAGLPDSGFSYDEGKATTPRAGRLQPPFQPLELI